MLSGLLIFVIATPAIVGPYGQKGGYTPDLHMAAYIQVGAMVILSLFMLWSLTRRHIVLPRSPLLLPLLCFYAWAMLSVWWADVKYQAIVDALDWSGAFLCALLILLLLRDLGKLKVLLICVLISGVLMALLGIGQWLFAIDWVQQHIVPAATFSNKNMAGQYGVLTLPIAVSFFLYSKTRLQAWVFAIASAVIMTYIVYTRARGAYIGMLVEIILLVGILIYIKRKHDYHLLGDMPVKKVALSVSLLLFVGMSFLTPSMFDKEQAVLDASIGAKPPVLEADHGGEVLEKVVDFTGSANTRVTMWMNSIPMFREHFLIGVGLGNWTNHYSIYQSWYAPDRSLLKNEFHANAHNDYIEILCELGIIGFALFIWLVVSLFRVVGRLLADLHEESFLLSMALILAIMGIAVNAVFSFPLKQPVPIFIVMVYIAVLSSLYGRALQADHNLVMPLPTLPFKAAAALLVILATTGLFVLHYNWYQSELHYRNSVIALQGSNFRSAYQEAHKAHQWNPLRTSLLWVKATALLQLRHRRSMGDVVEMLEKVDRSRPYMSSTLMNLSSAYSHTGRHREAAEAMGRLVKVQPSKEFARFRYGIALFNAHEYERAIDELQLAREHYQLSIDRGGDLEKAKKQMRRIDQLLQTARQSVTLEQAPAQSDLKTKALGKQDLPQAQ